MAKKITRGITGIKEINKQDFDTNNVNDLLSDGQYNYIHRKKGKSEEYHNLTDNIKTISSDNTDLLTVTNNNKTNNTATLSPKHDAQKEQVLESERNTITINHGTNGTPEKTKVDTNPKKVLEHDNLTVGSGLLKSHTAEQNTTNLSVDFNTVQQKMSAGDGLSIDNNQINIKPKATGDTPAKNGFYYGNLIGDGAQYATISLNSENNKYVQIAFRESVISAGKIVGNYRFINNNVPTSWQPMLIDEQTIKGLLAQKQNKLISNASIGILGDNTLHQLFFYRKTYAQPGGTLKTYIRALAQNTSVSDLKNEYNFLIKINQGETSVTFTLESTDQKYFSTILGASNTANISGCELTLSGSTLTVSTSNNTDKNYFITFSELFN